MSREGVVRSLASALEGFAGLHGQIDADIAQRAKDLETARDDARLMAPTPIAGPIPLPPKLPVGVVAGTDTGRQGTSDVRPTGAT